MKKLNMQFKTIRSYKYIFIVIFNINYTHFLILKDVHDNTEKFDPQKHFKLMDACKLWKYEDPPFEYLAQF